MKTIKRLVLGVFSSLLLAVGFVRAADQFDPMTISLRTSSDGVFAPCPTGPCVDPCLEDFTSR